jgi:diadenosine tetraphosphate (Ap4A) HIT family hydrolase
VTSWPSDWDDRIRGTGCPMCGLRREDSRYGLLIYAGQHADAFLKHPSPQLGYVVLVWNGRHVTDPTELTRDEAVGYWGETLRVSRALRQMYQPMKMNYETLGNSVPHLHTHILPRFEHDLRPGLPFPLGDDFADVTPVPADRVEADAAGLRELITALPLFA